MLYNLIKCTQRIHRHTSQVAVARFYHVRIPSQQLRNWKWPQLTKSDGIRVFRYSALFSAYPITKQFLLKTAKCERCSTVKLSHKNTRLSTLICDSSKQHESKFNWSLLWELIQPDIILFILAACSAMAVALVNIRTPIVIGDLINVISDILKNNGEVNVMEKLYAPAKKILLNCALQSALTCTYITLLSSFGERLAARMRVRLFTAILQQDVAFFDAHKTGEIINRLSGDIQDFKSSFKQVVSQGLRSATQILGCGITLYTMSPKLTTVMALLLPGIILVGTGFGSLLRKLSRKAQDQLANAMSVANEAISNIRTVRAFAMEEKEISWYTREVKQSQALNEYLGAGIGAFQALTNLAINGIVLVVLYSGAVLVNSGEMKPGDLMSYLIATQTVQKSLGSISVLFGQLVRGTSAGARVFNYIETRPSMRLSGGKVIDNVRGDISLQNVRFVYPCRPDQVVFDNLSLEIKAGKMIALCGSSGSGKSTLASLIENFYEVEGGRITIDGVDLNEIDPSWLRGELIGYINQEPTLFATSVMENIRYGSPDASDEQVYAAARKANADEFIRSFPQGYNTIVGERGATVSGGQKQRIAIARALLKDPKILILDEATSALDAESERLVQAALDTLIKGRTVIVIAHRLSTVQNADVIAAMSHGQIKEIGTHAELLKKNGLYAELIRRQTNKDEPTPL